jgi:tellurite resistance protein TehA-like permease
MSESPTDTSAVPISKPTRPSDAAMGASVLLSAVAIWFALWAMWIINSTYERYQGRSDLDMPDWFSINMSLTFKVLPVGVIAVLCDLVAAGLFLVWAGRAGWVIRIGFVVQWLASAAIVGLLVYSRLP